MAARWTLLMTSSLCLVLCSLCMTVGKKRGIKCRLKFKKLKKSRKNKWLEKLKGNKYRLAFQRELENYVGEYVTMESESLERILSKERLYFAFYVLAAEELGEDFLGKINNTLSNKKKAGLLFLMDESGRVLRYEFQMDLTTYKALAKGLQLSANRDAGIITFNHTADADIHLGTNDLCDFYDETEEYFYRDFSEIVLIAEKTVELNSADEYTLVFLVWDGMNTTNQTPATDKLKSMGHIEFPTEYWYYDRILVEPLAQDDEGPRYFFGSFYCPGKRLQRFT